MGDMKVCINGFHLTLVLSNICSLQYKEKKNPQSMGGQPALQQKSSTWEAFIIWASSVLSCKKIKISG